MIALLSQIVFMQPIILFALMALPVIWYLLRITPPAPKTIMFPATRFLIGLVADQQTPSKSPWWILLLRLLIIALIIIAMARPIINQAASLAGQGAIRIIIDNSWASANIWDTQIKTAQEIIEQAGREKRDIYILPTASMAGSSSPQQFGAISSGGALSILRGLTPQPWPANYKSLAKFLDDNRINKSIHSIWLSHGLDEGNMKVAINAAQKQGGISIISPSSEKLPLLLRPTKHIGDLSRQEKKSSHNNSSNIKIDLDAPKSISSNLPITVQALAQGRDILDVQTTTMDMSNVAQTISFDILETLKNKITKFQIRARKGAGSIYLLDDQFKKRKIGIAAPPQKELSAPLIEASYYIKRALEPYADITIAEIPALIDENLSVIIMPDIAAVPTQTLNSLEKWINDGGLLLRFSGENMAKRNGDQFLLPVILRAGGRSLSGSLSWDKPQTIADFSEHSPFYGLKIPDDITIKQQILADPAQDLENKIWAHLNDGTPFITASTKEKGLIVLIHTSANTSWSNFALSGLYVSILKRIIHLSGLTNLQVKHSYASLDPLLVIDGFGAAISPPASVKPIPAGDLGKIIPSSTHPPGIYGHGNTQYALNIGTNLPELIPIPKMPISVNHSHYNSEYEINIMPIILYCALALFCLDWIIMVFVVGNAMIMLKKPVFRKNRFGIIIISIIFISIASPALATDEQDLRFSEGFHLAYIITGDDALDTLSQRGLETLSDILARRTSVEPIGVIGLNPEKDPLAFFPIIYWPISDKQHPYSSKTIRHIQLYLDNGGSILFDTRDQNKTTGNIINTVRAKNLRNITASLNIPPIMPIPNDHVLGRSFYLLDEYPGRYSSGTLWVEKHSASGRDNVSSVVIGSNDWAGSWSDASGQKQYRKHGNNYDSKRQEMSIRFGVNLVMYALTGNYKADQVHIPHILKRLGE